MNDAYANIAEILFLVLPGLDLASDLLVVFSTKNLVNMVMNVPSTQWRELLFLGGLAIFLISQWIRLCVDGSSFKHFQDRNCCQLLLCGGLCGLFVVVERILRLALAPLDIFLCLGYWSKFGEGEALIRDRLRWATKPEELYYAEQSWLKKYWYMLTSIMSGGRWTAIRWEWIAEKPNRLHPDQSVNERMAKFVIKFVIAEEWVENLGGVLMSVAAILLRQEKEGSINFKEAGTILAISSLGLALISATFETGRYVATLDELSGQRKERQTADTDSTSAV